MLGSIGEIRETGLEWTGLQCRGMGHLRVPAAGFRHGELQQDGRGRVMDNIFIERLWRTVKYEEIYLKDYLDVPEAMANLKSYFGFYNHERPHQALGYQTPAAIYFQARKKTL